MKLNYRNKFYFLCFLYKLAIEVCYAVAIGNIYGYSGIDINFDAVKEILSWVMLVIIIMFSRALIRNYYLHMVNDFLIVFSYIPTIALWGIKDGITYGGIGATALYCIMMIFGGSLIESFMKIKHVTVRQIQDEMPLDNKNNFTIISVLSILFLLIMLVCHQIIAPDRWIVSLTDSLSARLEIRETYIPALIRYTYMILGSSLAPVLFVFSLKMKKLPIAVINLLTSYLAYTINGMKTYILIYVVAVGFYYLSTRSSDIVHFFVRMLEVLSLSWVGGFVIWKIFGNSILLAYLHRLFTIPAEIHYYYFDFFSKNELLFLRDSVGRFLAKSPYDPSASRVIGSIYYSNDVTNATDGLFSDFFANFGYVGLIIYPFIVFFVMALLERQLKRNGVYVTITVTFILLIVLINNTFFTWLITGGYLFSLILVYIIDKLKIRRQ